MTASRAEAARSGGPSPRTAREAAPLLTVVVPTYNERDNVERLVGRINEALAGIEAEIIFVDDSEDDTPSLIQRLKGRIPVELIHRDPWQRAGGLGTALALGLKEARGEYVCVLDADLQHPPEKLPELLGEAQRSGADVVVASRYRAGGSAAGLGSRARKLVSLGSKWLSQALFYAKLWGTTDPGSGFFLIRREVVDGVELRPIGYKMLTEVLMRGRWSTIAEVPYEFQRRAGGSSKATVRQAIQYLQHTLRLFFEVPDAARLWKFLMVGASGVVVNLSVLWLVAVQAGQPRLAGWAAGVETSIITDFLLNRNFTWRDRAAPGLGMLLEAGRYHLTVMVAVLANLVVFTIAGLLEAPVLLAGLVGIAAGATTNFLGVSFWVFRHRREGAPREIPVIPTLHDVAHVVDKREA